MVTDDHKTLTLKLRLVGKEKIESKKNKRDKKENIFLYVVWYVGRK